MDYEKTRGLSERLLPLLAAKCTTPVLIQGLLDRGDLTEGVLLQVLANHPDLRSTLLLKLISHPNIDTQASTAAFNHKSFSPLIAEELTDNLDLISDQAIISIHHRVLQHLVEFCLQKDLSRKDNEWQDVLLRVFRRYSQLPPSVAGVSKSVINLIKPESLDAHLGLQIFRIFGQNAISVLPMEKLIEIAEEKDVESLIDNIVVNQLIPGSRNRHTFCEQLLMLLVPKCSTPKLIDKLLSRRDLSPEILTQIMNLDLNSDLLAKLISHPRATPALKARAFEHNAFSPQIAQQIVDTNPLSEDRENVVQQHDLLKKLVRVCFAKQNLPVQRTEWQTVLLRIFKQYRPSRLPSSLAGAPESIIRIIKQENLSVDFGFQVFRVLGRSVISALPVEKMIDIGQEEDIALFIDNMDALSPDVLLALAQQCQSAASIDKLLQRKDLTEAMLFVILGKRDLTASRLLAVVFHPKATMSVMNDVLAHPKFSSEVAKALISATKLNTHQSHELFKALIKHCLSRVAQGESQWEIPLIQIVQKYPTQSRAFEEVIGIIREHRLNANLGLMLLYQLGKEIIDVLPLKEMIAIADDDGLNLIFNTLKSSDKLSEELLIALVKKAQSEQLIRSFLQMDVRWNVLQVILDKIPDYNNLHRALTHENASEEDCQNWLKNLADKQKIMQEEALSTDDPRKRVLTALDALKVKACTHAVKATEDEAYEEVARASITLYRTLRKEIEHYLKTLDNPEEFLTNCLDAIDLSREILSTHRGGAKQLLVDIVSAILALITFKFFRSSSHPWDFFESKTESIQIVEKLQGDIQDIAYSLGINQGEKPLRAEHRAYDLEDQRSPEEHLQPIAHPIGASQKRTH